ncbi:scabin-related ADP-ribosyltransferase [Pseudomonas kurunegalensis]|uniref:scabin-related ADP-ribosyltransferase n=1 Tax=Pseudomonas kurunegalensis TaxID=485880 RepID=UPI0025700BA9|nr:hypothetical protein [Pseudomonas kurunegalensis]WJD61548.1 hypothetical protein QQ992_21820 [Pseudomonas kurunegalensis]
MKRLVEKLESSLSDDDTTAALQDIIYHINNHPSELDKLKHELIARRGVGGCIAPLYAILKDLDFIPSVTAKQKLPACVYRGESRNPFEILKVGGFRPLGTQKGVIRHKAFTSESIYISATRSLPIAIEFASQHGSKWVYKLKPDNGICVNDFLHPVTLHQAEMEIIFPHHVPVEQIQGVAIADTYNSLATQFFTLDQTQQIRKAMINYGIP